MFFSTKQNSKPYVIDQMIGPISSLRSDFLTWDLAMCSALQNGMIVMWSKQRFKMYLQSQACLYTSGGSHEKSILWAPLPHLDIVDTKAPVERS